MGIVTKILEGMPTVQGFSALLAIGSDRLYYGLFDSSNQFI